MSASITNAGKEDWTYYNTFTGSDEHDLPANWTTLYIYIIRGSQADTILLLKGALPSGTSYYANGNDTMIMINANTNKISAISGGTAKVYYR